MIRNFFINTCLVFFAFFCPLNAGAKETVSLLSPDKRTELKIIIDKHIRYCVSRENEKILNESPIGICLSDGETLGNNPDLLSKKTRIVSENIKAYLYRFRSFKVNYREIDMQFKGNYGLIFRIYNEGVAYRFYLSRKNRLKIENEISEFNFAKDDTVYLAHSTNKEKPFASAFQALYSKTPLTKSDSLPSYLPTTVDLGNGKKATILESDLESYPGMYIQAESGTTKLKGVFPEYPSGFGYYPWRVQKYVTERENYIAETEGTRTLPWRILAISDRDTEMPVNNLVYALAPPNKIGNYLWVKPGKVAWDWWNDWNLYDVKFKAGINTETYKYYIDFAAEYGLQYIILDEGWYESKSGDMMKPVPEINLPELVSYAKEKGIGIVLWTVFNVLDRQLDEACRYYSKLGIIGFKVDFMDRDDQEAVDMAYRIAEKCAAYRLILDYHGFWKPTGMNRTFPNIVNIESVFGMEEVKWGPEEKDMPAYDVTFPYIRMMAGPVDFTPGAMSNATQKDFRAVYSHPMSMGTRCHQLAMYIVYDSPFTMLADSPTTYKKEDSYTKFLASLPVETDSTEVLCGKTGKFIVTARKRDDKWYVGGLTNREPRDIDLNFNFLDTNNRYDAVICKDGVNADRQAGDYSLDTLILKRGDKYTLHLAPGGGFAIKLSPIPDPGDLPTAVPKALHLSPFYKKYVNADGFPIVSSEKVSDEALVRAKKTVAQMLSKRKDILDYMISKGCKLMIIGEKENVCDIPEYAHICNSPEKIAYWNRRARGFGGAPQDSLSSSFGEENVLGLLSDRYRGESIMVHEFSHLIQMIGIDGLDPNFDKELQTLYEKAKAKGLWKNTYAMENKEEYFAECTQSFFNCNGYSEKPNGVHGPVNNRERLKRYDPGIYKVLKRYFPEIDLDLCSDNQLTQGL